MNKSELISVVASSGDFSKSTVERIVNATLGAIVEHLSNGRKERVSIPGFGTFEVVERKGRKGYNPRTRQEIDIPDSLAIKFKPSTSFKESVKGG